MDDMKVFKKSTGDTDTNYTNIQPELDLASKDVSCS